MSLGATPVAELQERRIPAGRHSHQGLAPERGLPQARSPRSKAVQEQLAPSVYL